MIISMNRIFYDNVHLLSGRCCKNVLCKLVIIINILILASILYNRSIQMHSSLSTSSSNIMKRPRRYQKYELNIIDNGFVSKPGKHSNYRLDYSRPNCSVYEGNNVKEDEMDIILIWNLFFDREYLYEFAEDSNRYIYNKSETIHRPAYCEKLYPNCRVTSSREFTARAAMIAFHWWDLNLNDIPANRSPEQLWFLYNHESPVNVPRMPTTVTFLVNGTIGYHTATSDIIIPYGEVERQNNPDYVPEVSQKSLPIIWFGSHCKVPSRRIEYIIELKRHIQVDTVGLCFQKKTICSKQDWEYCQKAFYANYYFYLSFENSLCDEYVTEKLFLALQKDIVPIVYGGANYTKVLPPKSFIDATKYHPKDLAILVKKLISDRQAYLEYFEWKKHFIVQADRHANDHMVCESCRYLEAYRRGEIPRKSFPTQNPVWEATCWSEQRISDLLNFTKPKVLID